LGFEFLAGVPRRRAPELLGCNRLKETALSFVLRFGLQPLGAPTDTECALDEIALNENFKKVLKRTGIKGRTATTLNGLAVVN
jgi:hypothetical protein